MGDPPGVPGDLRAAIDRVSDGILVLDRDWTCTFLNPAGGELLGRTPAELIGRNIWEVFPEAVNTSFDRSYAQAMSTQRFIQFEEYFEPLQALFAIRVFPSPDGVTIYFQDVGEVRRLADERSATLAALRDAHASRLQFEALVEASDDFIAISDLQGQLVYLSPGGRRLVGLGPDHDISGTGFVDYVAPAEDPPTRIARLLQVGRWTRESSLIDHRGGPAIPVTASSFVIHDPDTGEAFAIATVQRDLSQRIAVENRLRQIAAERRGLMDRLVTAQERERARIAADVHDDSVQALAAVDLRLGTLQRRAEELAPELNEQITQLQQTVSAATDRLRLLLFDLEPAAADQALVDGLRQTAAHIFEGTTITWTFEGDLSLDLRPTERSQAIRVAKEALTNAREHARASRVGIALVQQDGGVEIAVTDDGIGVDPGGASSRPGHRGLATMRDRAEIAGGWWRLERADGGGTTVRFCLPVEQQGADGR